MDVVPCWILQDPQAVPNVSQQGDLVLLFDRFLYGLKKSLLKLQLHLTKTLTTAGYAQSINDACLFYKLRGSKFSYVSTLSDDILYCVNCQTMVNEFKQHLITIYSDIQYHDNAKSYIDMAITRSPDLSQIYTYLKRVQLIKLNFRFLT